MTAAKRLNPWVQLGALCLVPFTSVLGNAMFMPVLPDLKRELGVPDVVIGLTVTGFSLAAGIGIPLAGYLADRYGRKVVVIPALLLYALGAAVAFMGGIWLGAGALPVLLGGRVVQGFGAAGMSYMAMAFVGDLFTGDHRVTALGVLEATGGLGKVVSPIVGAGVGLALGWFGVPLVQAGAALVCALAIWLLTREAHHKRVTNVREYIQGVKKVVQRAGFALFACLFVGVVNQFVLFGVLFYLSKHLESHLGMHGVDKGVSLMWPLLGMSLAAFGGGLVLRKWPKRMRTVLVAGLLFVLPGLFLVARVYAGWLLTLGSLLVGVGTGLQLPALNDLVAGAAPTSQRAGIISFYGAVRFMGTAFGPPIFGWLMALGLALPFWMAAATVALALGATLFLIDVKRLRGPDGGGGGKGKAKIPGWEVPSDLPGGTRI